MTDLPAPAPATPTPDSAPVPAPVPAAAPAITARPRPHAPGAADGMVPEYVRRLAWVLDDAIPLGGSRRVGIDGFLSLVPVVGDAAGFALAATVVLAGVRAGCSWVTVARMLFHALGESALGTIPLAGPVIAFAWKANNRNLRIIEKNLADREATRRESWKVLLVAAGLALATLLVAALALLVTIVTLWRWISG